MNKVEIEIGGKPRDFYVTIGMIGNVLEDLGVSMGEMQQMISRNPFKAIPTLMYHGYSWGFEMENRESDATRTDVFNWVDEAGGLQSKPCQQFIDTLTKTFLKWTEKSKAKGDAKPAGDKKKSTSKRT